MKEILDFWFTDPTQPDWDRKSPPVGGWGKKWFSGGPEVDKMI